jgi:hypothetical protein
MILLIVTSLSDAHVFRGLSLIMNLTNKIWIIYIIKVYAQLNKYSMVIISITSDAYFIDKISSQN